MHGVLSNVMEIRDDDATGTYRLMYTTKLGDRLFILDFFQRRAKTELPLHKRIWAEFAYA